MSDAAAIQGKDSCIISPNNPNVPTTATIASAGATVEPTPAAGLPVSLTGSSTTAFLFPLETYLEQFRSQLESRTPALKAKTIHDTLTQIRRVLSLGGIETLEQLQPRRVLMAIERLKAQDDPSPVTINHHVGSIRAFSASLAEISLFREAVLPFDPLGGLKRVKLHRDRRLIRAAFTFQQFQQLFTATLRSRLKPFGIAGVDRAHAYLVAAFTGMRKCEIRQLTACESHILTDDPRFELDASITKNGMAHTARVGSDAVPLLRDYLRCRIGQARLFVFPKSVSDDIRMLRRDLAEAGLNPHILLERGPRQIRSEQLDWHSFRVSYVSWLLDRGATVQEVMRAVGHRSEKMVMHYARLLEQRRQQTPARLGGLMTLSA